MAGGLIERVTGARPGVHAAGLSVLHLVVALLVFVPAPHTGGDNAGYVTLAESLVDTGRYLSVYDPERPPQTQYPPVFPALLALGMLLGLGPWAGLKIVVLLASTAGVALSYLWARRRAPPIALAVGVLVALSPGVLEYSHWLLSDAPFWAFTMLALWALEDAPESRARVAVAAVAIALAYFTRSAGLPLVLAALGWLVLRRRWRDAGIVAAVVLPLAFLWWLRARGLGGVDYVEQFLAVNPYRPEAGRIGIGDLVQRMVSNDGRYLTRHLPTLLVGSVGLTPSIVASVFVAFAVLGWVVRLKRPGVAEIFLPLYIGLLFVWPEVWASDRFLLPVYPVMLVLAGEALVQAGERLGEGWGARLGGVAVAGLVLMATPALHAAGERGTTCTHRYREGDPYACLHPAARDLLRVADWARDALPADAVVLSRKPRLFYVLSGKPGRLYPLSTEPQELLDLAEHIGARYLVVDRMDALSTYYVTPILARRPAAFCALVYGGPERAAVFGILPGAVRMPDAGPGLPANRQLDVSFAVCPPAYYGDGDTR